MRSCSEHYFSIAIREQDEIIINPQANLDELWFKGA